MSKQTEIVRDWYQVVDPEGYNVGLEHLQVSDAVYFLTKCLAKSRRKGGKIMHCVTERSEVDLQQFDDVEI